MQFGHVSADEAAYAATADEEPTRDAAMLCVRADWQNSLHG